MTSLKFLLCVFSIVLLSAGTTYARTPDKAGEQELQKDDDPNQKKGLETEGVKKLVLSVVSGADDGNAKYTATDVELRESSTAAKGQGSDGGSSEGSAEQ